MQVVIQINDEQYYEVCRGDSSAMLVPKGDLINAIRNGKPLPKGHDCDTCKWGVHGEPRCSSCSHSYADRWEADEEG